MNFGNPMVRRLGRFQTAEQLGVKAATRGGIANKSMFLIGLTIISALASAILIFQAPAFVVTWLIISLVGALICGLVASFSVSACPVFASLYAVFEGSIIGAVSLLFEAAIGGVVFSALIATAVTFAVCAVLYGTGVIKVGRKMRAFVMGALISIVLVNLLILLVGIFAPAIITAVYGNNLLGLIVNIIMVILGMFMLLIDFDNASKIVEYGLPKTYEWRAAFSLTLTVIWLYIEFLKLFTRIAGNRK